MEKLNMPNSSGDKRGKQQGAKKRVPDGRAPEVQVDSPACPVPRGVGIQMLTAC